VGEVGGYGMKDKINREIEEINKRISNLENETVKDINDYNFKNGRIVEMKFTKIFLLELLEEVE